MNNFFKKITYILAVSAVMGFATSCSDDIADEITSIDVDRLFSPTNVELRVVNRTSIRVNWKEVKDAQTYNVEVFETAAGEGTITESAIGLTTLDLPYIFTGLDGEVNYTIRVKALSETKNESKWTKVSIKTDAEQIFYALDEVNDLEATQVTLRWPAGETATSIVLTPGDITYNVTAADIAAGAATITGLTGETAYTATLFNGSKTRGTISFATPIDIGGAILVEATDDLAAMIAAAEEGDVFAIMPGTYEVATLTVSKSVALKAVRPAEKPVLKGTIIRLTAGLELESLILDGTDSSGDQTIVYNADGTYGALIINNCEIKNYTKGALYGNTKCNIASITITNNIYSNIECNGGDLFDFRNSIAASFTFTNNTVYSSAAARDGFRMDAGGSTAFPSVKSIINISNNTFNAVCNGNNRRILYIRLANHEITFNKNILSNTAGYYSNQAATTIVEMSNNNYFNAPNFTGSTQSGAKNDTGTYTTLDPGYADATKGNFTLSNEELIYNKIGDQRWW
ncbi:DUF4957 domain-containing protein [Bacteroides sp. 51]|uniref:DUF4957 domain-containing protein n=1 Tax=Bacteroides sp. 51 TaxID=2302938 RepID=UPI0013D0344B|nr:DUF4957 domain-containing protein [Bacteroides sp. 51]NDV81248.1 fibronectin type III domain-containing protein [Bacteroides sp. 51]